MREIVHAYGGLLRDGNCWRGFDLGRKCFAAYRRCPFVQSQTDRRRREGILLSPPLSPRCPLAIIAVPIIMVVLALPIIMAVFITVIIAMHIIMAVFIIAIIAALLAAFIAGLIIKTVIIIAVASGVTFMATAAGRFDKEALGPQLGASFWQC